jgi:acyl transferase domain-containing protein
VVLTRLDKAVQRGERVYATVLGAATNNDGSRKAGFSAPSFEGQVECLRAAHADAGINGNDIDYVEAHGTGTKLGDPLEVQALTEALATQRKVMLGSIKGNIGHLSTAAGIAGFIKTALMLHKQRMVPSRHADNPNRFVDWDKIPFRLAASSEPWNGEVAAVSSFGIGGTNAHVVLGKAPAQTSQESSRSEFLYTASARTKDALHEVCSLLSDAIPETQPVLAESTLLARAQFEHRCFALKPDELLKAPQVNTRRPVVLLFAGQGGAYPNMGSFLEKEGFGKCTIAGVAPVDVVRSSLAIADSLKNQGLVIDAVCGHSLGEWAAAAFAGVVPREEALRLAELRGKLMKTMEAGTMVSARAPLAKVSKLAKDGIEVACINGAENVVLAGPSERMSECVAELTKLGIDYKQLQTAGAFHTSAVDPILSEYSEALQTLEFTKANLPLLSNVTGGWHALVPTTVQYWTDHLRKPVRFYDNLQHLASRFPTAVIVEVGPTVLSGLVTRESKHLGVNWEVVPTLKENDEVATYLRCIGTLWSYTKFQPVLPCGSLRKASLPTYPFQRNQLINKKGKGTRNAQQLSSLGAEK